MTYNEYENLKEAITVDVAELLKEADNDRDTTIDLCYQYADSSEYICYTHKAQELCQVVEQYDFDRYDEAEREMFELLVTDKYTTMSRLYTLIAYHIVRDLAIDAIELVEAA